MMRLTFLLYAVTEQLNCPIIRTAWIPSEINMISDNLSRGRLLSMQEIQRQWIHTANILGIGYSGFIGTRELDLLNPL